MPEPYLFPPTSRKEMEARGWDNVDIILISGDAYVDHPSFGTAVICREFWNLQVTGLPLCLSQIGETICVIFASWALQGSSLESLQELWTLW